MEKFNLKNQLSELSASLDKVTADDKRPILINLSILSHPDNSQENKIKEVVIKPATQPILYKIGKKNFVNVEQLEVSETEAKIIPGEEIENSNEVKKFRNFFDKILKTISKIKDLVHNVQDFLEERNLFIYYNPETKEIIIFYQNNENLFPVWLKFKLNISGILLLLTK
jgi:hypothetical protein